MVKDELLAEVDFFKGKNFCRAQKEAFVALFYAYREPYHLNILPKYYYAIRASDMLHFELSRPIVR